jgi:C-terminal processing protease CtpA/Prc
MKTKLIPFLLLCTIYAHAQIPKLPNSFDTNQKIYELSLVWKELSYNLEKIQDKNLDSLYQAYLPQIIATTNDLEYYKTIQKFLAHAKNGHTRIEDWKDTSLDTFIARLYIKTVFRDNKIIITNFADYHADKLNINDEIIEINDIDALEYVKNHFLPYISTTNEENRIRKAMFVQDISFLFPRNTSFKLKTKNPITQQEKVVTILADRMIGNYNRWIVNGSAYENNLFYCDTVKKISYIRLMESSRKATEFFLNHLQEMDKSKTIILDIASNGGGQATPNNVICDYLIDKNEVELFFFTSRMHVPYFKNIGKNFCTSNNNDFLCKYYQGTAYLPIDKWHIRRSEKADSIPSFKGNVYVIIGNGCISAGETLAALLTQDERIILLGSKTAGAIGHPYVLNLPSGLEVFIETAVAYNYQQEDISTGITPHYTVEFDNCYNTDYPAELLECILSKINQALDK